MLGKILCWIGYHNWTWKFEQGYYPIILTDPPPDNAKCSRCGAIFKEVKDESIS